MKRNILIPRFYPGGFLKEMIGKVLDPYVKKLVPRQNVLKRMAKHYEKFEDASKYPGKEMEGNRQNYRDVFEDEFGMLRNKQFAANSNIPDAFVNTGRLNESQLKRMSDLYKLDPEQLTANELKELQELSRINSGLSQYQEPVAEWSPFVDLQRQPIDRRSIQLADYDQYSLPTVYNNIRPSVNASSATKNHGYPDWRLDPAQPLPDSYLPQEAVEVKASKIARKPNTKKLLSKTVVEEQTVKPTTSTKKSLLQSIEQKLRDEKRIGISNGQTITVNGEPQTWYLEKDRLTGKIIFKQAAKDATDVKDYPFKSFPSGADPNKPITKKSKIEAAKDVKNERLVEESLEGSIEPEVIDDEIMAELQDKMSPSERSQMRTHLNNNITRGYGKRIKYGARKAWNEFKLEMWRKYGRR